jgi:hypothetical protein
MAATGPHWTSSIHFRCQEQEHFLLKFSLRVPCLPFCSVHFWSSLGVCAPTAVDDHISMSVAIAAQRWHHRCHGCHYRCHHFHRHSQHVKTWPPTPQFPFRQHCLEISTDTTEAATVVATAPIRVSSTSSWPARLMQPSLLSLLQPFLTSSLASTTGQGPKHASNFTCPYQLRDTCPIVHLALR